MCFLKLTDAEGSVVFHGDRKDLEPIAARAMKKGRFIGISLEADPAEYENQGCAFTSLRAGCDGGTPMIDELPTQGRRVLVVDDSADAAVTMAMVLRHFGFQTDTAHNGAQALAKIRANSPDAVILDIGLPGMSGFEVARAIKSERPFDSPFLIAVSGYATQEDRRKSKEAGIQVHLAKPADPEEVKALLDGISNSDRNLPAAKPHPVRLL